MASNVRSLTPEFDTSAAALRARHEKRMAELHRHASTPVLVDEPAPPSAETIQRHEERRRRATAHDRTQSDLRAVRSLTTAEPGDLMRASADRLIAYAALTEQTLEGGYYTNIRLRASFARYADGFTLAKAVRQLCALYPQLGEVVVALFPLDEEAKPRTQAEIAERLHMSQPTVSRKLRKGLIYLGALYLGLVDTPRIPGETVGGCGEERAG